MIGQIQREVDRILLDYPRKPTTPTQIQQIDRRVRQVLDSYGEEYSALFDADEGGVLKCTVFHRDNIQEVPSNSRFFMTGDWIQFLANTGNLQEVEVKTMYQMTPEEMPEGLNICLSCAKDSLTGIQDCGHHPTGHWSNDEVVRECEGWEPRRI